MFRINTKQMQAFENRALAAFEQEMVAHFSDFSPPLAATLDEEQRLEIVRFGIRQAEKDGFTLRGSVRLYLEMIFLLGSGFSSDPQYPWVAKILRGGERKDELDIATALYERLATYRTAVNGHEDSYALTALEKLEALARHPPEYSMENLETALLTDMAGVYPEKVQHVGEGALRNLFEEGSADAQRFGIAAHARSIALICILMFAFGHQCTHDPLYPWIGRTLADPRIVTQTARVNRLEAKALTWLRHVLDHFGRSQRT